jgi:hypothetical protein
MAVEVLAEAGDDRDPRPAEILMVEGPTSLQIHNIHAAAIGKRPGPAGINAQRSGIEVPLVGAAGVVGRIEGRRFGEWLHIGEFAPWPGSDFATDGFRIHPGGADDHLTGEEARVGVPAKGGKAGLEGKSGVLREQSLPAPALGTEKVSARRRGSPSLEVRGQSQHHPALEIGWEFRGCGLIAFQKSHGGSSDGIEHAPQPALEAECGFPRQWVNLCF